MLGAGLAFPHGPKHVYNALDSLVLCSVRSNTRAQADENREQKWTPKPTAIKKVNVQLKLSFPF